MSDFQLLSQFSQLFSQVQETLEQIKEEKMNIETMKNELKEERENITQMTMNMLQVKADIEQMMPNGNMNEYVKVKDYSLLIQSYNILVSQHEEIMANYANKHEIGKYISEIRNEMYQLQNNFVSMKNQIQQQEEMQKGEMNKLMNIIQPNQQLIAYNLSIIRQQEIEMDKSKVEIDEMKRKITKEKEQINSTIQSMEKSFNTRIDLLENIFIKTTCNKNAIGDEWLKSNMNNLKQLEQWTGLKHNKILFDSDSHLWTKDISYFDNVIIGKRQLVFLIEAEDGEKFGYYLNTEIIETYDKTIQTDKKSFQFNLQSNGRLPGSMKFEIKDLKEGGYILWKKSNDHLIGLGDIVLMKENKKFESCCYQFENSFNYYGIENAICGKTYEMESGYFTPKRILVIQMK